MQGFFDFLASVWLVIWGVLAVDPGVTDWFRIHPLHLEISMTVAALAGVST